MMTEKADPEFAKRCLQRAVEDVEGWLALLDEGKLSSVAPFGQMFVYQLQRQGKLNDRSFAVRQLCELYYRRAGGKGEISMLDQSGPGPEKD